jgi:hypothetical protein
VNRELVKAIAAGKYDDRSVVIISLPNGDMRQDDVEAHFGYSDKSGDYQATDISRYVGVPQKYVHYDKRNPGQFDD